MKRFFNQLILGFTLMIFAQCLNAQVRMERRLDGDGAFHLKEIQTILTSKDDTVRILLVLPQNLRPEGYADITLAENDKILMVNAKRVKTIQQVEEIYNALAIGETFKMGIQRDGQLMLESFDKIDPEKMPKGQNIMVRTGDGGSGHSQEGMMVQRVVTDGADGLNPWFGTGLMLGLEGDKIKVMEKMQGQGALSQMDIVEGDEIVALNGKKAVSIEEFLSAYEKLETDSQVELEYSRAGKSMKVSFRKPNVRGNVIMRREN